MATFSSAGPKLDEKTLGELGMLKILNEIKELARRKNDRAAASVDFTGSNLSDSRFLMGYMPGDDYFTSLGAILDDVNAASFKLGQMVRDSYTELGAEADSFRNTAAAGNAFPPASELRADKLFEEPVLELPPDPGKKARILQKMEQLKPELYVNAYPTIYSEDQIAEANKNFVLEAVLEELSREDPALMSQFKTIVANLSAASA